MLIFVVLYWILETNFLIHKSCSGTEVHRSTDNVDEYTLTTDVSKNSRGDYECYLKDHPYMVSVRTAKDFKHRCAGTIISEFWVLTVAQCSHHGSLLVVTGSTIIYKKINHMNEDTIQWALVDKIYIHKHFDAKTHRNDIALMELNYGIKETDMVHYANLADYLRVRGRALEEICRHGIVVGWRERILTRNQNVSDVYELTLLCMNLTVTDYNECRRIYEKDVPDTMVCAFLQGKTSYKGFLGGPLMCQGTQYGLISTGSAFTSKSSPELYTRIGLYEDFIHQVIVKKSGAGRLKLFYIFYLFSMFASI